MRHTVHAAPAGILQVTAENHCTLYSDVRLLFSKPLAARSPLLRVYKQPNDDMTNPSEFVMSYMHCF
jgi:hypothetical protein